MIAIVDYGVGNLFSLVSSFKAIGVEAVVTKDKNVIENAEKIVLPGVGAFGDAAKKLTESGLREVVIDCAKKGKPLLGICLGMQMLLERSFEYGKHEGLGLIKGDIVPIQEVIPSNLKVPHIGWNALNFVDKNNKLFKYINDGDFVYFVHSYYATNCNAVVATTEYGASLTAIVNHENVYGCQFHPEKSGEVGLKILRAFSEIE